MSERTEAPFDAGHGPSPSLRLLAAERLEQIERQTAGAPTVDLRQSEPDAAAPGRLAAVAASLDELVHTTSSFHELLTGRHLDYSEQVRRLVATSEQALEAHKRTTDELAAELRSAVSRRDDDLDRMGAAVGHISRDLAAIIEQVMAAVRQSREISEKNDEVSHHLVNTFQLAVRHLAEQAQVLRGEVDRLLSANEAARPMPDAVDDLRGEVQTAVAELRDELREDLSALRKLLTRPDDDATSWREALAGVRIDVTSEVESWARELHEDQALMMRELLASKKEIEQLRKELVRLAPSPSGGPTAQLETEMGRLLIELRALRRRPLTERTERSQPAMRGEPGGPAHVERPRLQPVTRPAPAMVRPALRARRPKRA